MASESRTDQQKNLMKNFCSYTSSSMASESRTDQQKNLMKDFDQERLQEELASTSLVHQQFLGDEFVTVISGGGSGHDPAHAGFVGEGMLTIAVSGDVFAAPPIDAILSGIRAVTGSQGCLLIIQNYVGHLLNFGLAAERAKSEGYKVEVVIVGDDCAFPPPRVIAGRRGLAGIILVQKVAGAAAAAGLPLIKVAAEATHASEVVGTMCVGFSICTLPGQVASNRLGPGKMELGIGIHGEPGAAVVDIQSLDVVVSRVLEQILSQETHYVPVTRGSRVVLMVNGLGATPMAELTNASEKAVSKLQLEHGLAVDRVYTGSFMTSRDMEGFSISIMRADEEILKRLDAPTKAPYWPISNIDGIRPPAMLSIPTPPCQSTKNEAGHLTEIAPEVLASTPDPGAMAAAAAVEDQNRRKFEASLKLRAHASCESCYNRFCIQLDLGCSCTQFKSSEILQGNRDITIVDEFTYVAVKDMTGWVSSRKSPPFCLTITMPTKVPGELAKKKRFMVEDICCSGSNCKQDLGYRSVKNDIFLIRDTRIGWYKQREATRARAKKERDK